MSFQILVQPEAREQALAIDVWWRAHRLASPALFANELIAALDLLRDMPGIGQPYHPETWPGLRRLLLRATRFHVYYVEESIDSIVRVLAIWSSQRGGGPPLRSPGGPP